MTAFTSGAGRLPAWLALTRAGLHQVAQHILAAALHAETGEVALMPSPGGFRTPPFGRDGRFAGQAFSHIGLVNAAWAITQARQRAAQPAPIAVVAHQASSGRR